MWLQYDREELYQKVWEQPMLRVAEQYCVSSVALGNVCRKLSVPVPGRGHWAKLAHGKPGAKKLDLPKLDKVPVFIALSEHNSNRTSQIRTIPISQP